MMQEPAIPLYEEVVNGFNKLLSGPADGKTRQESSDLRRARQSAFDKFRELGFPSIKNEDWKYNNIARFLKDNYVLEGSAASGKGARTGNGLSIDASVKELVDKAAITDLDCYRVVLVNGSWL